jgi:hypothetical protein
MIQTVSSQTIYVLTVEPEDEMLPVASNGRQDNGALLAPTMISIAYVSIPEGDSKTVSVFGPSIKANGKPGSRILHAKWSTRDRIEGGGKPYDERPGWVRTLETRVLEGAFVG